MRVDECVRCKGFPCLDVKHGCYAVPGVELRPEAVSMVMISEAAAEDLADNYYAKGKPLFQRTTVQAFNDAGVPVTSAQDILDHGIYLTTAIKCGKSGYGIQGASVRQCSQLLEKELRLFPNLKALMLMGDVAIKAVNYIAQRAGQPRVIPPDSTYKIREQQFFFRGMRVFPSYLQAGLSFFLEKSKRRMIAEDIGHAMHELV